jgi:quinol monooxygenase YgiN
MEAEFDDADALTASMASPEGQAVVADIPNYATGGAIMLSYPVQEAQLH